MPATTQTDMWQRHATSVHAVHSAYSRIFSGAPPPSFAMKSAPRKAIPAENSIVTT